LSLYIKIQILNKKYASSFLFPLLNAGLSAHSLRSLEAALLVHEFGFV